MGQDLMRIPAEQPCARLLYVELERSQRSFTLGAVEPVLISGVGVVSKEFPKIRGVLSRRGVLPVLPRPDLEKRHRRQRGNAN